MNGLYFSRYVYTRDTNYAHNTISYEGIYYNTRPAFLFEDQGINYVGIAGDITYSRIITRDAEPAYNFMSVDGSRYFSAYSYVRDLNYGYNTLTFQGTYFRDVWETEDSALISIDFSSELYAYESGSSPETVTLASVFSGVYTPFDASLFANTTLDYWLEVYQRPTYNMGRTVKYFSI
jgi:hypothetical protein